MYLIFIVKNLTRDCGAMISQEITGGVTLEPVASRCIIPNELVWNDALGRHRSLMHWRQLIIRFPMHQRLVANRCIIPIELQLDWNNASVRNQR